LRARNQDNQVRRALAQPRRRGQGFKDKPTEWKKGTLVWTKKEGTGVSSLEQQWEKATIKRILPNRRSAIVTLEAGGDLHRQLDVLRRRYHQRNNDPTSSEIEELLLGGHEKSEEEEEKSLYSYLRRNNATRQKSGKIFLQKQKNASRRRNNATRQRR
jgi:hypothetical protein